MLRTLLLIAILLSGCASNGSDHLKRAEELSRDSRFDEAISEYRKHMEYRLSLKTRPADENPYFYLLLIGDVELGRGDPEEALKNYEEAEQRGVHNSLVSDRYRSVARWYEEHEQLNEALQILKKYRDRDDLLFDAVSDRIARELTAKEEQQASPTPPK